MQILFIASREYDYLQDLTYAGLVDLLGKDSVVEFPYHWQYHKERRFFWNKKLKYPKNLGREATPFRVQEAERSRPLLGTVPFLMRKEWGEGHPLGLVSNKSGSSLFYSLNKIEQSLKKNLFDLVILPSVKPDNLTIFSQLTDFIRVPWILIDGGDWQEIGGDFKRLGGDDYFNRFRNVCRLKSPSIIFKREMPIGNNENNVFPLQFSVNSSKVSVKSPAQIKKFQVQFWAVESSQTRREAFKLLKGRYDCDQNGTVAGQKFRKYRLKGDDYFNALNQSRISLSFRGEGFDTLRYWEIPACGSLLISENPAIQIPNNFLNKKHAVFCRNDLSDLLSLIDYYLEHEKEADEIAEEGQKHLLKHHTHIRRAEYLLDVFKSKGLICNS